MNPMRILVCLVLVMPAMAITMSELQGPLVAQQPGENFEFFEIPAPNAMPVGLAMDSRGRVYFAAYEGNFIGQLDPATRQFAEFAVPTAEAGPLHVAVDGQDNVWFTETGFDVTGQMGSKIGKLDPASGKIVEFDVPTPRSGPYSLAFDSQGRLWFTEIYANQLAEFNPDTGQFKEYIIRTDVPSEGEWPRNSHSSWPTGISVDAQDNVWVTLQRANKVVMLHPPSGTMIEFSPKNTGPSGGMGATNVRDPGGYFSGAARVAAVGNGSVWFTIPSQGTLAHLDRSTGRIQEYSVPTRGGWPLAVAVGGDGKVWFNEHSADKLGVFDPSNQSFREFQIPGSDRPTSGRAIFVDSQNRLWFSDEGQNRIGYIH